MDFLIRIPVAVETTCRSLPGSVADSTQSALLLNGPAIIIFATFLVAIVQAIIQLSKPLPKKTAAKLDSFGQDGLNAGSENPGFTSSLNPTNSPPGDVKFNRSMTAPALNFAPIDGNVQKKPKDRSGNDAVLAATTRPALAIIQRGGLDALARSSTGLDGGLQPEGGSLPKKSTACPESGVTVPTSIRKPQRRHRNPRPPKRAVVASDGPVQLAFPQVFTILAMVMNINLVAESILVLVQSVRCVPAEEPILFYLFSCLSIHVALLLWLSGHFKAPPSLYVVSIWFSQLVIEAAIYHHSPIRRLFDVHFLGLGPGSFQPVYYVNIWVACRLYLSFGRCFCMMSCLVIHLVCSFEAGTVFLNRLATFFANIVPLHAAVKRLRQIYSPPAQALPNILTRINPGLNYPERAVSDAKPSKESSTFAAGNLPSRSSSTLRDEMRAGREILQQFQDHQRRLKAQRRSFRPAQPGSKKDSPKWSRSSKSKKRAWSDYVTAYRTYAKYLWPKPTTLRVKVVLCVIICLSERVIKPLSSHFIRKTTTVLDDQSQPSSGAFVAVVPYILAYGVFRFLQGSQGLLEWIRRTLWQGISQFTYEKLSLDVFDHVQSLPYTFHINSEPNETLSAINKGNSITTFLENVSFAVIPAVVDMCIQMAYFVHQFGASYARIIGLMSFWYIYSTLSLVYARTAARRELSEAERHLDRVKIHSLRSYQLIKMCNTEGAEKQRMREAIARVQRCQKTSFFSQFTMEMAQSTIFVSGLVVIALVGAKQIILNRLKTSDLITLIDYIVLMRSSLNVFSDFYRTVQNQMVNAERITELFKQTPFVPNQPGAKELKRCDGDIRFNNIKYAYEPGQKFVLNGLDLHFLPGQLTAMVGVSGGGKSTVFSALLRLFEADEGEITIDGKPIKDYTVESIRDHIAIVPQHVPLVPGTILENLIYGSPQEFMSEEQLEREVYQACELACIHGEICKMPLGYQTPVGSSGDSLSGGQKQRLGLARAIMRQSQIILLDEFTSALDAHNESLVLPSIERLAKEHGRTVVMIAHRLSTVVKADNIYVLENGRVAEQGTQTQLMKMESKYRLLWIAQHQGWHQIKSRSKNGRKRRHSLSAVGQEKPDILFHHNLRIESAVSNAASTDDDRKLLHGSSSGSSEESSSYELLTSDGEDPDSSDYQESDDEDVPEPEGVREKK